MNKETSFIDMDDKTIDLALNLVYKHTGIRMSSSKKSLLQGRFRPRMRELNIDQYHQYLDYVVSNKDECQFFINLVTTNETYFFRTQRVWDFFQKEFLPKWSKENPSKVLRVWSAAASTGEEAHTIAICCDIFKSQHPTFQYEVRTSDIDTNVLKVGEVGEYLSKSIDSMRKNYLPIFEKYIIEKDGVFKTVDSVHQKIKFFQNNLFSPSKDIGIYDIVFLRNVLIYFEGPDQEKVINNIAKATHPGGCLIIGESESLNNLKTPFVFKSPLIYELK
jgi:chemotaxis protein methyltransferase CheR